MDANNIQLVAGMISTVIFTTSNIPMLVKAAKTHDLKSYSDLNIALGNIGNLIHWVYIFQLPFGPIWFLHGFYTLSSALMCLWYFRYEGISLGRKKPTWLRRREVNRGGAAMKRTTPAQKPWADSARLRYTPQPKPSAGRRSRCWLTRMVSWIRPIRAAAIFTRRHRLTNSCMP